MMMINDPDIERKFRVRVIGLNSQCQQMVVLDTLQTLITFQVLDIGNQCLYPEPSDFNFGKHHPIAYHLKEPNSDYWIIVPVQADNTIRIPRFIDRNVMYKNALFFTAND